METTAHIALSRQMVLRRQMDVIAQNIANMTTSGFRAEAMLLEPVAVGAGQGQRLAFVQDVATIRDLDPGSITTTGNPLDLAIEGRGYFVVETPDGPRYTRSGQFRLNDAGELVTAEGRPVLDDGGAPLAVPPESAALSIAGDGTVSSAQGVLGRIDVVTFQDEQRLEKAGGGLYRTEQPALPAVGARLVQGALEGSNVQPVLEMTRMMTTVRAYQGTHRLLDAHHEMQRRAIETMLESTG
jgi:flagellar basal-body rod protein FlgF